MKGQEIGRTVKRSITLDENLDAAAHRIAGDRGFSDFVNEAVRLRVQQYAIANDVARHEREKGPIPAKTRIRAEDKVTRWLGKK